MTSPCRPGPPTRRSLHFPYGPTCAVTRSRLILDEVHQLPDPGSLLKIGADGFPRLKILATGSSTLAATRKFRDSLTGRTRNLHLVPVRHDELSAFGVADLRPRLLRGGLPPALLSEEYDPGGFTRNGSIRITRGMSRNCSESRSGVVSSSSSKAFCASALATLCGLSRPIVVNYLEVLELTHVATLVGPFFGGGHREFVRQPKIYGFDTGFVACARGWSDLRPEDCGLLWEHLVLEQLI